MTTHATTPFPASVAALQDALAGQNYLAERGLATAIFLALRLGRPLFLEGEAGVGKTEVAKVLAALLGRPLIRLQCYEGLDAAAALYEWNYAAQLLHIRVAEAAGPVDATREAALRRDLFSRDFLLRRPLLQAIDPAERNGSAGGGEGGAPVLLIDELDRADEEFEAFLLEVLSDFQVTIPELGVIKAPSPPVVVLTSNRTREVHDALKRRCLYAWIDYPSFEKEYAIVLAKAPHLPEQLTRQIVAYVQRLRAEELYKPPGVAETLDWAAALAALDARVLDAELVEQTLGVLLKHRDDVELARARVPV
jgi:MoxR-like ATPase